MILTSPLITLSKFTDPVFLLITAFVLIVVIIYSVFSSVYQALVIPEQENVKSNRIKEIAEDIHESRNVIFFLTILFYVFFNFYHFARGTNYESHVVEWLNLIVRWVHIVFGIAWIGASFYFVFLENALNRTENVRDELAGNLWAIHGGGFYYLEKYKIAPSKIPRDLHWFKYEAYFTWVSGFALLAIVYYLDAKLYMVDPQVMDLLPDHAILIGIGTLIISWLVYDGLCKSPLINRTYLFVLVLVAFCCGVAWFLSSVFSSRAAYMHFGAMIGTLMAGNVFRVIIPSQKAMVKAAKLGLPLDPALGKNALSRSMHNNYFTLPVLFVMISNHFPSTYGNENNWMILAGLSLTSALVKHYLNLIEKGEKAVWIIPISSLALIGLAIATAPKQPGACDEKNPVTFIEVNEIIQNRCVSCHSASPTDDLLKVAPNNVIFDTPENILKYSERIHQRAVLTKTMPQGNKTGMTQEERDKIGCWIQAGAVR